MATTASTISRVIGDNKAPITWMFLVGLIAFGLAAAIVVFALGKGIDVLRERRRGHLT